MLAAQQSKWPRKYFCQNAPKHSYKTIFAKYNSENVNLYYQNITFARQRPSDKTVVTYLTRDYLGAMSKFSQNNNQKMYIYSIKISHLQEKDKTVVTYLRRDYLGAMSKKLISALSRLLFSIQLSLSSISDEIKGLHL